MNCRLYGLVRNSYVDGPGVRMAIFFQGCLHHCNGCQNPESWPINGGDKADTEKIIQQMKSDPLLKGITLSGGEPFLQPGAALALAKSAHMIEKDVWCYTGYTFEEIMEWNDTRKDLLKEIDVLVDGEFEIDKKSLDLEWRGSSNQRIIDVMRSLSLGKVVLWNDPDR